MDANAAESSASRGNDRSHRKRQAAKVLWRDNEVAQKEKTRLQKRARVSDAEVKKLTGNCVGGSLCATVTDAIKAFWFCAFLGSGSLFDVAGLREQMKHLPRKRVDVDFPKHEDNRRQSDNLKAQTASYPLLHTLTRELKRLLTPLGFSYLRGLYMLAGGSRLQRWHTDEGPILTLSVIVALADRCFEFLGRGKEVIRKEMKAGQVSHQRARIRLTHSSCRPSSLTPG